MHEEHVCNQGRDTTPFPDTFLCVDGDYISIGHDLHTTLAFGIKIVSGVQTSNTFEVNPRLRKFLMFSHSHRLDLISKFVRETYSYSRLLSHYHTSLHKYLTFCCKFCWVRFVCLTVGCFNLTSPKVLGLGRCCGISVQHRLRTSGAEPASLHTSSDQSVLPTGIVL